MDNLANDGEENGVRTIADRVLEMAGEIEAGGDASFAGENLERARALLHQWVDSMTAVVVMPALGRVTVIHDKGLASTIASPDLPFTMSTPVADRREGWDDAGKE